MTALNDPLLIENRRKWAMPLCSAEIPPLTQHKAIGLGGTYIQESRAKELSGLSRAQREDLAALTMRWFPSWEPYRPAHDEYRRVFDRAAGRYALTGSWAIYSLTSCYASGDQAVACAVQPSLRIEDAWFTQPFICETGTNEGILQFFCCEDIVDAFVAVARCDKARWLVPAGGRGHVIRD